MQRAIALQAQAERERRAKIIGSEGEYQAAQKLADAADIISQNPATLQLRYLQTLLQIGVNEHDDRLPAADRPDGRLQEDRRRRPFVAEAPEGPRPEIVPSPAIPSHRSPPPPPDPPIRATSRPTAPAARLRAPDRSADRAAGAARPRQARAAAAHSPRSRRAGSRRRRDLPVLRGARGADAAGGLGRTARAAAPPTRPGWLQRSVPNLYPVADRADAAAAAPARPRVGPDERGRPARGPRRGRASRTCSGPRRRTARTR